MPWLIRLLGLLLLAAGIGLLAWGMTRYFDAAASSAWPTVPGKVLSSEVKVSRTKTKNKNKTTFGANIRYQFQVNNQDYEGTQVSFGDYSTTDRSHADAIVKRYAVGAVVTVHYNPDAPGNSVMGGVFAMIGLVLIFALGRSTGKDSPSNSAAPAKPNSEIDERDSFDFSRPGNKN
jgi:hypothetical protein